MLEQKEIRRAWSDLGRDEFLNIHYDGAEIIVRSVDNSSKLSLASLVYEGSNFIPKSIRRCLTLTPPFSSRFVPTFLTVDEGHFQVKLNYLGRVEDLSEGKFRVLIEEFGLITGQWRDYLDDHGKRDLLPIHVKR